MATKLLRSGGSSPSGFTRLKAWIAGVTSVLVVLPALVNAGYDIYAKVAKLPKTDAESTNEELFKKYFNKEPVLTFPVPVKQDNGTVEVRFAIYDEGDVFVEFGRMTQWFRFPAHKASQPSASSFLISTAHAQPVTAIQGSGSYVQKDTMDGKLLIRQRRYANGVNEKVVLETRSGLILERTSVRAPGAATSTPPEKNVLRPVDIPTIDLDAYKRGRSITQ